MFIYSSPPLLRPRGCSHIGELEGEVNTFKVVAAKNIIDIIMIMVGGLS